MRSYFNRPGPDLGTPPSSRRRPWAPWMIIFAVAVLAALAWNFWPRAIPMTATVPAADSTMTEPPATQPTTAPAQQ